VSAAALRLIVGLGNPGAEYAETRHNAGFWFCERLARQVGVGGLGIADGCVFGRIHIGAASGKQDRVATLHQVFHLAGSVIQRNADRLSSRQFDCSFILWQRSTGVFRVTGVWHGNGNARAHRFDCSG
jgi:hypothetical protein